MSGTFGEIQEFPGERAGRFRDCQHHERQDFMIRQGLVVVSDVSMFADRAAPHDVGGVPENSCPCPP